MSEEHFNRYRLVHVISKEAAKREIAERNPLVEDENGNINPNRKTIEKRNYVKEVHDEVVHTTKDKDLK